MMRAIIGAADLEHSSQAGSVPSLIAGGGSGAAMAYGVLRTTRKANDVGVVVGVLLLHGVFGVWG